MGVNYFVERGICRTMERSVQGNSIIEGVIWKQLLIFFFPILIGTFFQQLYNTVDTIIVGQYVGKQALAAVGTTSTLINLLALSPSSLGAPTGKTFPRQSTRPLPWLWAAGESSL